MPNNELIFNKQLILDEKAFSHWVEYDKHILITNFHNTFINIAVDAGLIGLALIILFYLYLLKFKVNYEVVFLSKKISFFSCFFIAYLFQIILHNASIFYGDCFIMIVLVLVISCLPRSNFKR